MTPQQYITIVRAAHQLELARLQYAALLERAGLNPFDTHHYDDRTMTIRPAGPPLEPPAPEQ